MGISLKQTKVQLQGIVNELEWTSKNNQNQQRQVTLIEIGGLKKIRSAFNILENLDLFNSLLVPIKSSIIFTNTNDAMNFQILDGNNIIAQLNNIKSLSVSVLNILTKVIPEEQTDSINIKLPHINDFDELSEVCRKIHLGLTQVLLNDDINGETKIASVENGSIWLNVIVGAGAISFIGGLIWASAVIRKKYLEGDLLAEQIRGYKAKNESIEDILQAQKAQTELMIKAESEYLASEYFKKDIPENTERIKNSIKIFSELIKQGAEIHPALIAPENVSNLFPDLTNIIGIDSKIKRLGNPHDN